MKMSDVFKDGCQQFDLFLVDDYTDPDELNVIADFDKDYVKSVSEKMASYAAHAINNHDRLVEENAELREAAGRLVELFNGVVFTHKTHRDRVNFLNARNNLKQLLNK